MKNIVMVFALILLFSASAAAQGNAFSFQGRLNDGSNPANGQYDLQFRLYDAATGGTQIGPQVLRPRTTLINGVFSVVLDFGASAFQNPNTIFIEIAVKPNGSPNAFTILGPRQQLTVVPFASRSQNATNSDNAANLGGVTASEYITRTNGGADFIRNSTTAQPNSNFNVSGAGTVGGNFSIGGNQSIVGSQNISGNQIISGTSNLGSAFLLGDATQVRTKGGIVKAMIFVNGNGTIARCFNGIGVSTGNCGFTITKQANTTGRYLINFGFKVDDRFFSLSPQIGGNSTSIGVNFITNPIGVPSSNVLFVTTFITDIESDQANVDNPFMVIVY